MTLSKCFNGRRYYLNQGRYVRRNGILAHDVWNFNNPKDPVLKGEAIHHENGDPSDDRIINLEKMTRGEHNILHKTGSTYTQETKNKMSDAKKEIYDGEKNPNWKGGLKHKVLHIGHEKICKDIYYSIKQYIDSNGEILNSNFGIGGKGNYAI